MGLEDSGSSSMKVKSHKTPRLATNRSNWITWKQQTLNSLLSSKGVHRHIQGTIRMPPPISSYPNGHTLDDDEMEELEKIEKRWDLYNQHEALIKAQILTTVPEATAVEIHSLATRKEIWDALCAKHEKKALTVIVDLQRRMYALKCLDKGNVKTHMENLNSMYKQLKGMSEKSEDGDFMTLILASLPKGYCPLINTISLHNHASMTPLKP